MLRLLPDWIHIQFESNPSQASGDSPMGFLKLFTLPTQGCRADDCLTPIWWKRTKTSGDLTTGLKRCSVNRVWPGLFSKGLQGKEAVTVRSFRNFSRETAACVNIGSSVAFWRLMLLVMAWCFLQVLRWHQTDGVSQRPGDELCSGRTVQGEHTRQFCLSILQVFSDLHGD